MLDFNGELSTFDGIRHGFRELDWVWLHPFSRNRKMLRNNWDTFRQRFGQFSVAAPLSAHMSDFIRKHHVPPNHKQGE